MDPESPSSTPRKVKFAPKGPPRRIPKPTTAVNVAAVEDNDDDEETQQSLRRKVNEHLTGRAPKVEKKSSVQVALTHGAGSSTTLRSFGKQRETTNDGSDAANTRKSTAGTEEVDENLAGSSNNTLIVKKKKEYKEPWDYEHSYYPTTLPLRRPYSGDPEVLDKAEFEEAVEYDENTLSSASELGLLNQDDDAPWMLLFQLPSNLRDCWQPTRASGGETTDDLKANEKSVTKGKETAGNHTTSSEGSSGLEKLAEGQMGKMLVYKSGAVKLKLGDALFDVSAGIDCAFPQRVMAMNTSDKVCCELGEVKKRVVVTPDIDSMMD